MRHPVRDGALAGLAGGAASAVALAVLGEGPIGKAIELEEANGEPLVSRPFQQAGGVAAVLAVGLALGIVFGVTFAAVRRRMASDDWGASLRLAAVAFMSLALVPFLKYPANPPGVGDPETIGRRTVLYLVMVAWSGLSTWASWRAWCRLTADGAAPHLRGSVVALLHVALVAAGLVLLPGLAEEAVTTPATLLWQFRVASLGGALALWTVTGIAFGWLRARVDVPAPRPTAIPR